MKDKNYIDLKETRTMLDHAICKSDDWIKAVGLPQESLISMNLELLRASSLMISFLDKRLEKIEKRLKIHCD